MALADELAEMRIERIVVESTSDYWRPFFYLLEANGLVVWLVIGMGLKRVDPVRAAWVSGLIGGQDAGRMIAAWRAAMAFDSRPRLGEIRCPTLVLAGAADTAVPMHHGRQLHEGIAHSRLVAIDGANHAMIWTDPDRFASEVDAFLES